MGHGNDAIGSPGELAFKLLETLRNGAWKVTLQNVSVEGVNTRDLLATTGLVQGPSPERASLRRVGMQ